MTEWAMSVKFRIEMTAISLNYISADIYPEYREMTRFKKTANTLINRTANK